MSTPTENGSSSACRSPWRLVVLLAIVLAAIMLAQNRGVRQAVFNVPAKITDDDIDREAPAPSAPNKVLLTINFGDGRWRNGTADWRPGMTVADVLNQHPRVSLQASGSGESAFLTSLNGVANEGTAGRNWTYSVNGKFADRSFFVYKLRPNDHILWTFAADQ